MVYIIPTIGRLANLVVEMDRQAANRMAEVGHGRILTAEEAAQFEADRDELPEKGVGGEREFRTIEDTAHTLSRASAPSPVSALKRPVGRPPSRFQKA